MVVENLPPNTSIDQTIERFAPCGTVRQLAPLRRWEGGGEWGGGGGGLGRSATTRAPVLRWLLTERLPPKNTASWTSLNHTPIPPYPPERGRSCRWGYRWPTYLLIMFLAVCFRCLG